MEKFEAKLVGYIALADYMANIGLQRILGDVPIFSNKHYKVDTFLSGDDQKVVCVFANRIHVPGTRHLYSGMVQVGLVKIDGDHWQFRRMSVFLHHPDTMKYSSENSIDISLEPGVENLTGFTSEQYEVDDSHLAYSVLLPAYTSHFVKAE